MNKYTIPILIVVGFLFLFLFFISNHQSTGKVIENHPIPQDCSEETIRETWEFVFKGSSDNLQYVSYYNESNQTQKYSKILFSIDPCYQFLF